ncbi:MAG: DUF3536 domain-containing protein [Eubacteriales bacterium]
MERSVCIHGHFYQPPRENPWLEDIELQDSAYPYHDWDERITAECYEPNTVSRILDGEGWIRRIINNYTKMSFNFGPTLLSWMEDNEPEVYRAIIEADRASRENFSGHGSALAQAYNHMIMPLANDRDKYTQVLWGIKDFESRFGRPPEGMWLPETAVDLKSLDIMAEQGIRFTILAPYQARRFRQAGSGAWHEVGKEGIDTTIPYLVHLPGPGRTISVFFYNAEISRAVAFEKLLFDGGRFADRILGGFSDRNSPQLVNLATDGETYGHHHRHGEMALSYALHHIESNNLARLTNYAEYLEHHPPAFEVEIIEHSAWSCAHGVGRWQSNCGCNSGMHPGWGQEWRVPLRKALDWLRDELAPRYEERARQFLKDPWGARNEYVAVILDRSEESFRNFLSGHASRELSREERIVVLKLLEMQRHAMLMFTSCGWFFDEISGIETVQVLQYAGRVIQLAGELFDGIRLEPEFLKTLAGAKSNIPEHRDGAVIFEKFVKPAMVDLRKVGGHYAICSLFESYDEDSHIYCYDVHREDWQNRLAGEARMAAGRARVNSQITLESADLYWGVVNFGGHNVSAGVRDYQGDEPYRKMLQEVGGVFDRADFAEVLKLLGEHFEGATYSLKQLFRDKQRKVLDQVLDDTLTEVSENYRRIFERHAPLMRFLKSLNIPQPKVLHSAAEFVLNTNLRKAFMAETLDLDYINALLDEAKISNVPLDGATLGYVLERTLERMGEKLGAVPTDQSLIAHLDAVVGLARSLPFEVDLWMVQNVFYTLLETVYKDYLARAGQGDGEARSWVGKFASLGDKLKVRREE